MSQHRDLAATVRDSLRITRRAMAAGLLSAVAFGSVPVLAAPAIPTGNWAESFTQENIDKGYAILKNMRISADARHMQFRTLLLGLIDAKRIGLFTLGQYANGASKADLDAFVDTFADYTVAVYEVRLNEYKDQILKVTGSQARSADDVVVNCISTDPAHPNDTPTRVAFRIRRGPDGRPIVTDLNVEGIWQTISQRSDFIGFLQQHGGRISDLVTDMKRQIGALYSRA